MKICVIPIDNRPVCYNLFKDIAKIDKNIELYIPERKFLGDLTHIADIKSILDWLKLLPQMDKIIISLDTMAYGGLIPSRRCTETFEQIKQRIEELKAVLETKKSKIYAFSSIMRISNNNVNVEEKTYWDKYGKKIFDYSYQTHKLGSESCIERLIPNDILEDYLKTRKRNFEINKLYLEWQKQGFFDTLVFSKDDCAEYGFNVQEAKFLEDLGGFTKTGADEIPLTLFARALDGKIKVAVEFTEPECKDLISNYEDVSIEKSVQGQLSLAGMELVEQENANILLLVNNFKEHQGEIVMKRPTDSYNGNYKTPEIPYMIADVRFANGADNVFANQILASIYDDKFCGYSAWNTSANSLGSLLCAAKVKFLAQKYDEVAFKRVESIRFLDDWAYQANVRQTLDEPKIFKMEDYEEKISRFLNINIEASYSYPWNRLFEIEVNLK